MADLGNIGELLSSIALSDVLKEPYFLDDIIYTEYTQITPIQTDTNIYTIKYPMLYRVKWILTQSTDEINIDCELSSKAASSGTAVPKVFDASTFEVLGSGTVTSGTQSITVQKTVPTGKPLPYVMDILCGYANNYDYDMYCTWFLASTNGEFNPYINAGGSTNLTDALNCSYPIGEEQPIDYSLINLTGSGTNTLTFTIPANTFGSDRTDAQILLTLSPPAHNTASLLLINAPSLSILRSNLCVLILSKHNLTFSA